MNNFASLRKNLSDLGLSKLASSLANIEKIYKTASLDLSKEKKVIETLFKVIEALEPLSLHSPAPDGLYFPPYSTATSSKNIVYSGEDLSGYTKAEIMHLGIPNFLKSFTSKYMSARIEILTGQERKTYDRLVEELTSISDIIKSNYAKITKPIEIPKNYNVKDKDTSIRRTDLAKINNAIVNAITNMNTFLLHIQDKEHGYLQDFKYAIGIDPDSEEEPEVKLDDGLFPAALSRQYLSNLKNLHYDFNRIRKEAESKFAGKLKISEEELVELLNLDKFFIKTAATDEENKDLLRSVKELTEQTTHHNFSQNAEYRKAAAEIIKGQMSKFKKNVKFLMSPELVLGAWEYLKEDLRIKYEVFLQTALDLKLLKQQKGMTHQESKETKESKDIFARQIDKYAMSKLRNILEITNAR